MNQPIRQGSSNNARVVHSCFDQLRQEHFCGSSRRRTFASKTRAILTGVSAVAILSAIAFFAIALVPVAAQTGSHLSAVDPSSGKVDDTITATGESLGKAKVIGVFLSDDKNDYKATVVDQEATKIVFKVPQVKAGDYNVSIQVGTNLLIQPVRFTVEQ